MNMLKISSILLACGEATSVNLNLEKSIGLEDREQKLGQSIASAFKVAETAPRLMNTGLPATDPNSCPGTKMTFAETGGAFLDGCYANTTR